MRERPKIDRQAAALAHRQQDQISRRQLLSVGLGPAAITHRAANGRLWRVHTGVFSLVPPPLSHLQAASAAVLACSPDGALAGASALALWWSEAAWPAAPVVYGTCRRRRPGIATRQVEALARADVRVTHGIRVTSPARTLLDCAPERGERATTLLLAQGRRAGLIHPAALEDVLARFPRHAGTRVLRAIIADPAARARSEFEVLFPAFCARYGLPTPLINSRVNGRERDAYFDAERLIVELDSWEFHRDRFNFHDDRERDAEALVADLATYRLTWERFTETPEREARRLRAILVSRGSAQARRSAP